MERSKERNLLGRTCNLDINNTDDYKEQERIQHLVIQNGLMVVAYSYLMENLDEVMT
jgi:hypothetical protein